MKKIVFSVLVVTLSVLSCVLPTVNQLPKTTNSPTPDVNATAEIFSQQTLDVLPSDTIEPTITLQEMTATGTATQATATQTENSILLTLTATLGTGTVAASNTTAAITATLGSPTATLSGTLPATKTPSPTAYSFGPSPTGTPHPQYSGTLPPFLPYDVIELSNISKADAYISMRCVTSQGNVTIIEYPVKGTFNIKAPIGRYTFVVWVGGRKIEGSFSLGKNQSLSIIIHKNQVEIK